MITISILESNLVFFGLLIGVLILIVSGYFFINRKNTFKSPHNKRQENQPLPISKNDKTISQELGSLNNENFLNNNQADETPIVKGSPDEAIATILPKTKDNTSKEEIPQNISLQEDNPEPEETSPDDAPSQLDDSLKKPRKPLGKYHVLFRQSDQRWIVKRENADRIIRVLETQKEAISFATIKALTNDTTIVIHKKDGKIRKQNYTKSTQKDETV